MTEAVIGVIFDFDETLGPDTISYVLSEQGVDPSIFWKEINGMVDRGWDPPLAYMHVMQHMAEKGEIDLSVKKLSQLGKKLKLFPGLPNAFSELKDFLKNHEMLKKSRVGLEFYIISGGLEELLRATKIGPQVDGIFGCNFAYEKGSVQPVGIKSAISFTEKTRFIHGIRKGIDVHTLRSDPYRINDSIEREAQRIPFSQMVYIGDGPSDIPCLSAVTGNGGAGIGVSAPFGSFKKGYELARGKRITVGPYTANYKAGSDMRKVLEETILRIALTIDIDRKKNVVSAPGH